MLGDDVFVLVGDDGKVVVLGALIQIGKEVGIEDIGIHQFACLPVGDFASVVGEDIATVFLQFELLGYRGNAVSGTARCQYDFHATLLCVNQCAQGVFGYFFLVVGQRTVEVED